MYKKICWLFVVILGCTLFKTAHAQKTEWGLQGGLNITNIYDTDLNPDNHVGFMGGFYLNHHINDGSITIQPEVNYSRKGFQDDTYRIGYIEIPVLAGYDLTLSSSLSTYFQIGPYLGIKTHAETPPLVIADASSSPSMHPSAYGRFYKGDINPIDYGFALGGGIDIGRINLGVRYSMGLREVSDDENANAKHQVFSVITAISI